MIGLSTGEAREDFSTVITAVATIVSLEVLALLWAIEDRRDAAAARAALEDAEKNGTVPWEKIKADLGLAVAEN